MKFTDLNENDLVHFTYDGDERVVHVHRLEVSGSKKFLSGHEVTDDNTYKKFNFDKAEDLSVVLSDVSEDVADEIEVEELCTYHTHVIVGNVLLHIPQEEPEELYNVTVRKVNGKKFVFVGEKQLCEAPEDL